MSISYLVTLEELSVLAHFCNIDTFQGMPAMPLIDSKQCSELLNTMNDQGLVHLSEGEIAIDIVVRFILRSMANPTLFIQMPNNVNGYCTDTVGVMVSPATRAAGKYKITPLPNANALAYRLWESLGAKTDATIIVQTAEIKTEMPLTRPELETIIAGVYMEVSQ